MKKKFTQLKRAWGKSLRAFFPVEPRRTISSLSLLAEEEEEEEEEDEEDDEEEEEEEEE